MSGKAITCDAGGNPIEGAAGAVTYSATAQNTFSEPLKVRGDFNLSLSGTWVGTVHLQRRFNQGSWMDVQSYTANIEDRGREPEGLVEYRAGVKTGNYTSGTVLIRISR